MYRPSTAAAPHLPHSLPLKTCYGSTLGQRGRRLSAIRLEGSPVQSYLLICHTRHCFPRFDHLGRAPERLSYQPRGELLCGMMIGSSLRDFVFSNVSQTLTHRLQISRFPVYYAAAVTWLSLVYCSPLSLALSVPTVPLMCLQTLPLSQLNNVLLQLGRAV